MSSRTNSHIPVLGLSAQPSVAQICLTAMDGGNADFAGANTCQVNLSHGHAGNDSGFPAFGAKYRRPYTPTPKFVPG